MRPAPAACSGKINLEYLGSTSDEYVFGNRIIETVVPQSGVAAAVQQAPVAAVPASADLHMIYGAAAAGAVAAFSIQMAAEYTNRITC
jgi:hypothetical protein